MKKNMQWGQHLKLVHDSDNNEDKNLIDEKSKTQPSISPLYQVTSPLYQDDIFIIMWPSNRSGGTYSEIRKSEQGKDRFLQSLEFMGQNMSKVKVIKQAKPWVPIKGDKTKSKKGKKNK